MKLALCLLFVSGCAARPFTTYRVEAVVPHRDQLVVVATRSIRGADGRPVDAAQTVNACDFADEGDRLVCRPLDVEFDAPAPPLGVGYRDGIGAAELTRVNEGGVAALAGLAGGDLILTVDGKPTPDAKSLRAALERAGRNVTLAIRRGEQQLTVTVRR